jgi:putative membrane protein
MHLGFGFWPLFPLFWIGMILFFCWGARHWFGWRDMRRHFYAPGDTPFEPIEPSALEILRRRYARGEIDGNTFDQMRERLESSGRPRE